MNEKDLIARTAHGDVVAACLLAAVALADETQCPVLAGPKAVDEREEDDIALVALEVCRRAR